MSDRYTGGNGPPDDLYRFSGGGNGNNNNDGSSGGQGDLYRFSGTNNSNNRDIFRWNPADNGNSDNSDPFANDRMPGQQRPSDYPQEIQQRYTAADGTVIINNVHCKNAYFNQNPVDGADYRTDPNMDFRNYDPNARNLRQQDQSSYYNNNDDSGFNNQPPDRVVSPYNGSFRSPPVDQSYYQGDNNYSYQGDNSNYPRSGGQDFASAARAREQAAYEAASRANGQDIMGHNYGGANGRGQDLESANEKRCRAQVERQLREQMYQRNCQAVNEAGPIYQNQPYYQDQGYYPSNGNRNGVGVQIGVHSGGGSPCFGQNGTRISASVRLPGGIRIGGNF